MKIKSAIFILLLLFSACADRDRPTHTFDTAALSTEQQAAFYEAQAYWEAEYSDPTLFEPGPPYNSIVHFVEPPDGFTAWSIKIGNWAEIRFSPGWTIWENNECFLSVTKHELGHIIGLNHSTDPSDPMYYLMICLGYP